VILKGPFRPVRVGTKTTYMPFARVALSLDGRRTITFDGLLDSGAAMNVMSIGDGAVLLGKSEDELQAGGTHVKIQGVGATNDAFAWQLDLLIRPRDSAPPDQEMMIPKMWVHFVKGSVPAAQMLIGQFTLEDRIYVHINRTERRYWVLRN
jgi:hypothetical protein